MTSKERVLTTLAHNEPDRLPIDFGATMETTIHQNAYRALKNELGICIDREAAYMLETAGFARVDQDVQEAVGADVRGIFPYPANRAEIEYTTEGEYKLFTDEFGMLWRKSLDGGLYFDIFKHPLGGLDLDEIQNYPFPDPRDERRFAHIPPYLDQVDPEAFPVVFDNCFGNGIFQTCNQLMGYDTFLMAMALGEAKAEWMLDRILEMKIAFWDEVLTRFGDRIDVVKELDDMGTQINLLISPDMYKELIKPRLVKLVRFIKSKKPDVKMMMHSCGSIYKIIPDLIEAGVEVLNPVQYSAAEMDPVAIKKNFGDDLVIWGGGCDTQKVLPTGTKQDVIDETKRMLDIFMPGGGFVFAPVHAIQADVPVENMLAMWDTVKEYGNY